MRYVTAITLLIVTAVGTAADSHDLVRLKLRSEATVYGKTVTLGDILNLSDSPATLSDQLAEQPVLTEPVPQERLVFKHEQVVTRLNELGVNLAYVLVGGASRCTVTIDRSASKPAPHARTPEGSRSPYLRDHAKRQTGEATTLADLIRRTVDDELAEMGGRAELRFERAGHEFLTLTTPPWEFRIHSSGGRQLGLREFRVLIRRDGKAQRTVHLYAQVQMVRDVVVTTRPLSIGNFIKPDDVELVPRVFEAGDELGLGELQQVVGQQACRYVPRGELVTSKDIKAVDLVQRSRPVVVRSQGSSIDIRLSGVALDSGSYGDSVRVRLGETHRNRRILRGIVTGVGTVRIAEGQL